MLILILSCLLYQCIFMVSSQKTLVLVGGSLRDDNEEIYGKIVDLAGGVNASIIGIITAANESPEDSAQFYTDIFLQYGATEIYWVPVHLDNKEANSDPEVVARIQQMTGFWFGGGNQRRILESFYNDGEESPALAAIRATYEGGAVVSGTSAGATCMSAPVMITDMLQSYVNDYFIEDNLKGGRSYEALLRGSFPVGEETDVNDLTYEPNGGLGFIKDVVLDIHFSEQGREGRLFRLISDTKDLGPPLGSPFGIGIDEDTALVITNVDTPSASGEVIGTNGVLFANLQNASADTGSVNWGIIHISTHYLTADDTIQLADNDVTFASWKSPLKGAEVYNKAATSLGIFKSSSTPLEMPQYTYVSTQLFNAKQSITTYGVTAESTPRFKVIFVKDTASKGYGGLNPITQEYHIAYYNLQVQIEEGEPC